MRATAEAIPDPPWTMHTVTVVYVLPDGEMVRLHQPYTLVFRDGEWYLVDAGAV